EARQGAPEGIVGEGKSPGEIEAIARALLDDGAGSVLVTRANAEARAALLRAAPDGEEDARARLAWVARDVPEPRGRVTIVSGGGVILYLDGIGGAAGDMLLGALLDAGGTVDGLERLGVEGLEVRTGKAERHGIVATTVTVTGAAGQPHRDWLSIRAQIDAAG